MASGGSGGCRTFARVHHEDLARWVELYERAWRSAGTDLLDRLFTPTATYSPGPFDGPIEGSDALGKFSEAERQGPDEQFALSWNPVAVEGDVGVARVEVRYAGPPVRVYRDLWIVTLDREGRCTAFEEWPFFPGQPLSATTGDA